MVSLLANKKVKHFGRSYFYWAAFISHGYSSVRLDDAFLDQIHDNLQVYQSEKLNDNNNTLEMMVLLTLTQDAHERLKDWEQTLSNERL